MGKVRFYPISYYRDKYNHANIIVFAYRVDGERVALRFQYRHQFYVEVDGYSPGEINSLLEQIDGAGVDGDVVEMGSSVDLHTKIKVVSITAIDNKSKNRAIEALVAHGLNVHNWHSDINPLVKMMVDLDVRRYAWMDVEVGIPTSNVTKMKHEYIARWDTLRCVDETIPPPPFSILSFDIETDSQDPRKMSDPGDMGSCIRIVCMTMVHGPHYEEHSIIYGDDINDLIMEDTEKGKEDIPNLRGHVHIVNTELDLVKKVFQLFMDLDPDIITGHNHLGFDIPYLVNRYRYLVTYNMTKGDRGTLSLPNISRLRSYKCTMEKAGYTSSAASITNFYIDAPGITWVDTLTLVIKQFFGNIPDGKLDTVASILLNMGKDNVTAQDMFKVYRLNRDNVKATYDMLVAKHNVPYPEENPSKIDLGTLNRLITTINVLSQRGKKRRIYSSRDIIDMDREKEYASLRMEAIRLINRWNIKLVEDPSYEWMRKVCWYIVTKYCMQDARIPYQLLNQQGIIQVLCEQATIFNVDIHDVIMRGSVYKVNCSQYSYHMKRGVMMDFGNKGGPTGAYDYIGGYVAHVKPGLKTVPDSILAPFDFSSLYPTIIVAMNLCHTTWVPPNMRDPSSPDYIWLKYKEDLESRADDPMIRPIIDAPYDKKGELMCNIYTIKNDKLNATHVHWFLKKEVKEGVVPGMLWAQYNERKAVRAKGRDAKKKGDHAMAITYEAQQQAIKVAMNSTYGAFGTEHNAMANYPVAETICHIGRESIHKCNAYVEDNGIGTVVYNDTDSAMVLITNIKERFGTDVSKLNEYCHSLAEEISSQFTRPMMVEYEGAIMSLIVKAPKMYTYIECDGRSLDLDDYTREYIEAMGLMKVKGMAPVRRDKYKFNKILISDILCRIMLGQHPSILIKILENAISFIWRMKDTPMCPRVHNLFSYSMGVTARALAGGSSVMAEWAPLYTKKYNRNIVAGERFDLLVAVGSDPDKHNKAADKLVTYDWFIDEGRTLDVIHYIKVFNGGGNVIELLNIAFPDVFDKRCIDQYYIPKLRRDGKL